jgi:cytochrome P450
MTAQPPFALAAPPLYPPTVAAPARPLPTLRYLARFVRNPIAALPRQVYEEPLVAYGRGRAFVVWVSAPRLLERILLHEAERFPKTPVEQRIFAPTLGRGILTSEGAEWRWQRKIAAPLFRHAELLRHVPVMADAAAAQLARWRALPPGDAAAVDEAMTETTFEVITHTILAGCDADEGEIIRRAGQETLDAISWSIAYAMLDLPDWVWHPGKGRMLRAAHDERAAVARLVRRRRGEADKRGDILGRLLEARRPDTGEPMSDEQLVDNLVTFLAAGHETTAKLLTWALYLLARAPAWQERLRAEAIAVAGEEPIAADHIERLVLTQRVLKETMRLYPPAPVVTRVTAEAVELDGTPIDKGVLIVMPIYAVHRHRKIWHDPDRFDPDRFLPEREATYERAQYMPFGFGPRTCIGSSFAMIEATTILATLLRGARFGWDGRHAPEPVSRVTLRPKGGMPLQVTVL